TQYKFKIQESASGCRAMLVLIGPQWLAGEAGQRLQDEADWVHREVRIGVERKEIWVVPVTVKGAGVPAAEALPHALKPLADYQGKELRDEHFAEDVHSLIDSLIRDHKIERSIHPQQRAVRAGLTAGGPSWWWLRIAVRLFGFSLAPILVIFAVTV